jgi:hypothetical protein
MQRAVSPAGLVFSPATVVNARRHLASSATGLAYGPVVVVDGRRRLVASPAQAFAKPDRFKMIGFDPGSASYEVWIAVEKPDPHPPSGHALTDVAHVPLRSETP